MTLIFARRRALKARRISQVGNDRESRHARATAFLGHMPSNMPSDVPAGSWTRARIMPTDGPGQRRRDHAVGWSGRTARRGHAGAGSWTRARTNGPGQFVDERTGATSGSCRRTSGRVGVMPAGSWTRARTNGPGQFVDGGAGVMPMNGPGQFVDERTGAARGRAPGSCRRTDRGNAGGIVDEARGSCRRAGVMKIFRAAPGALSEGARHDREKGISDNVCGLPDSCRHFPQSPGRMDEGRIMETANGVGIVLSEAIDGPRARVRVLPVSLTGDRIW